jgi:hypothetical protein
MNRVTRGTVVLAAAIAMISCKGDPTGDLRNGIDHLVALPGAVFLRNDSTKSVLVEAVDKQGNRLGTTFSLGNVAAGITVIPDDSFNLVYDTKGNLVPPKNWTRIQYKVTGAANDDNASFVVTAGGKSLTIPVRIVPDTTNTLAVNATAPALGDTVTATAGTNFKFTPASRVSLPGATVVTLGISADSTQILFLPGPSGSGAISVNNMVVSYAPALAGYTGNSGTAILTTPAVTSFPAVYSSTTPALNDTVTVSAAGFKFLPNSAVTVGGRAATVVGHAADSSSVSFVPVPGTATGTVSVSNIVLSFLTSVSLTVPAATGITVPGGLAGTGAFATAPTIPVPAAVGASVVFLDAGAFSNVTECGNDLGGPCRMYKIVVAAGQKIGLVVTWQGTTDIGVYTYDNTQTLDPTLILCDSKGAGAAGQPESCSATFATAGTYYLAVDSFAPFYAPPNNVDPTDIKMVLTGQ